MVLGRVKSGCFGGRGSGAVTLRVETRGREGRKGDTLSFESRVVGVRMNLLEGTPSDAKSSGGADRFSLIWFRLEGK